MAGVRGLMAARDWAYWFVLVTLVTFEYFLVGADRYVAGWIAMAAGGYGAAVGFRRTRPLVALAGAGVVTCVELVESAIFGGGFTLVHLGVLVAMSYFVGRDSASMRGFVVLVVAGDLAVGLVALPLRGDVPVADAVLNWFWLLLGSLVFVVLPWLFGRYREQHARLVSAGWERAERIESEQRMAVEQARLRERNRIAQDMHDSLGHELSLIALRSGALEVDAELSERHRRSAADLRASAAVATERLGEIVGVLRAGDEGLPIQPPTESVAQIADRAAGSGMEVKLRLQGGTRDLPPRVAQAAARVVQEALTNAAKHSPGATVTVTMEHRDDAALLHVANGRPVGTVKESGTGGHGLTGLDERVRLVGGSLAYGPTRDGFQVTARMPYVAGIAIARDTAAVPERPAAATELADARLRARRGLVTAITAPAALGLGLGAIMLGYYLFIGYNSVLDADDYARIEVGQQRKDIEDGLPLMQMVDAPTTRGSERPPGALCEHYRSGGPLSTTFAYRLCFDDGTLVLKEKVQSGSVPIDDEKALTRGGLPGKGPP